MFARRRPCTVQRVQEPRPAVAPGLVAHRAVARERQLVFGKREQDVPARRRPGRGTFQQRRVTPGVRDRERQQVARTRDAHADRGGARSAIQTRLNSRVPLVPPKPNELEIAMSILPSRAVFGTKSRSQPSPGSSRLIVGGSTLSRIASRVKIASTPPAAPSRWPVTDLVELIASL